MNLILKGRGVDLNERLREYATDKLSKTQRVFERIIKMEVVFSEASPRVKMRHKVEVTVKTPGETLRAAGAGTDYFAAIDMAHNRLEAQVRKFKERLTQRGHRADNHHETVGVAGEAPSLEPADEDGESEYVIVRTKQFTKPMTPEEAVLELEASGMQFLLFRNAVSRDTSVVYRRPDGSFVLVEPQG